MIHDTTSRRLSTTTINGAPSPRAGHSFPAEPPVRTRGGPGHRRHRRRSLTTTMDTADDRTATSAPTWHPVAMLHSHDANAPTDTNHFRTSWTLTSSLARGFTSRCSDSCLDRRDFLSKRLIFASTMKIRRSKSFVKQFFALSRSPLSLTSISFLAAFEMRNGEYIGDERKGHRTSDVLKVLIIGVLTYDVLLLLVCGLENHLYDSHDLTFRRGSSHVRHIKVVLMS